MDDARTLVLLRHAKATEHTDAGRDLGRPLAPRGVRDAEVAGRWIAANLDPLDLVVLSPAVRVAQTWLAVAGQLTGQPEVDEDRRLYGQPVEELYQLIRELPGTARSVLLVGHNPEMSVLASSLVGSPVGLSTCSIAVLRLPAGWGSTGPDAAELVETLTPRAD